MESFLKICLGSNPVRTLRYAGMAGLRCDSCELTEVSKRQCLRSVNGFFNPIKMEGSTYAE